MRSTEILTLLFILWWCVRATHSLHDEVHTVASITRTLANSNLPLTDFPLDFLYNFAVILRLVTPTLDNSKTSRQLEVIFVFLQII